MMTYRWNKIAKLSALGACCSLAVWISSSSAKDEQSSILVKNPAAAAEQGPVLPPPSKPTNDIFAPQTPQTSPQSPQPKQPVAGPVVPPQPQQAQPRQAQPPAESQVKRPFMRPAVPREPGRGQLTADPEPMPLPMPPQAGAPGDSPAIELDVRPAPPIKYDTDGDARDMYRSSGEIRLVMVTQNPADGCYYEIPLCIPGCCAGDPIVKSGRGIFGRGVTEYCWPCGFRAIVKFRQVLGDVRVDYEGD